MTANLTRREAFAAGALAAAALLSNGAPAMSSNPSTPFRIEVPQATLTRFLTRVREAHWPQTSAGAGWTYGVDAGWFRQLVTYWGSTFDWRKAEAGLNATPQFLAEIDGRKLHFAHRKPTREVRGRPPILLLHGWPYSFATMLPLAERLAGEGWEVVIPSLPGCGFSPAPDDRVRGLRFIARRIDRLMTETLGHDRYLVHGGDYGAVVADWLAIDAAAHVAGIHANMSAFRHAGAAYGTGETGVADATPEEAAYVRAEVENMERESAYFRLQLTRPETVAYALTDSPVGWAAYMLDKWQKWTGASLRPFEEIYGDDRLLTEVMIFLATDTVATSLWPYAGFATEPFGLAPGQTIDVPFAYSSFADPLLPRVPRRFVDRSRTDIRLWREHQAGGHFPMLEATQPLAEDIVRFADLAT